MCKNTVGFIDQADIRHIGQFLIALKISDFDKNTHLSITGQKLTPFFEKKEFTKRPRNFQQRHWLNLMLKQDFVLKLREETEKEGWIYSIKSIDILVESKKIIFST